MEEGECARIGYERQKPYLGNPTHNVNYAEGDVWEMWQHSVAAGSELAFARMMGLTDFTPHVNKWKTEEDVPPFEIRYFFTIGKKEGVEPTLRFTERDNPDNAYVLLVGGLEKKAQRMPSKEYASPPYIAIGWIWGRDCMKPEYETSSTNYRRWNVPASGLRSMTEISPRQ
jgi:hypothetical protein